MGDAMWEMTRSNAMNEDTYISTVMRGWGMGCDFFFTRNARQLQDRPEQARVRSQERGAKRGEGLREG